MSAPQPAAAPKPLFVGDQGRRLTIRDLARAKRRGEHWPMLTAYDAYTAGVFDEAGIPVLLVGDSSADNHLGYDSTVPVTLDELIMLGRAVVRGTKRSLIVSDLPFGSYEESPEQALRTAVRLMKEVGCGAVKLEGGVRSAAQIEKIVTAGIPVMAHLGYTPQSVNGFGGPMVAGRGADAAKRLREDAEAVQEAGAFAVVLEVVPAPLAEELTASLEIPTVGIGAGAGTDGQVLVWTDFAGMTPGRTPSFVKKYADLRGVLGDAARAFGRDVVGGAYPDAEHSFS
ncbi:3-methyl-2-oxobutanoate hydroxymethyltransferase [Mangrovactinospora gilvigrisea]|uniref:3-methyl-2-oxobutanoate hydroxymethyltransferase n=1 Tax=Mangrovactinospora gilvigrisea TaxID=1428644 RepID=A0A1J7C8R0_9ACTN|nr:3-methyl-2-oxobutanoate hydroxymethyltransferase [Mangrovactinospora gilvigrisea]OIV37920.1 3-methyl-2-oxobutanoate hydroxymethyltransferase [Mangrovactinospora gilvigrisea]